MSHYLVTTDKMAENNFYFGRKWQTKYLVSPKKSSTFVASKENTNQINKKIMEQIIKETIKLVINKKDEHYYTFEIDGVPHRFDSKWANCVSDYHAHLWISDPYYRKNTINAIIESEL